MTKEDFMILSQLLDEKFEPVYTRLDVIESDVKELKQDVATLKSEMSEVKEDVATLKSEMSEVKEDVAMLKREMSEVKEDIAALKSEMSEVKEDIATLKSEVSTLKCNVATLEGSVSELNQRVSSLELTIENETNVNIKRIAEGHCDLVRNLREARKVDDEKELLAIRVTVLESDMSKVKNKLAIV